ncbi:methyl-accepting chemotaxis protein [Clostridium oceanicum]|uniref:Methyl-accepting chemotaxis protein n=1 Tax=Clostridium oceanicum TaxID=1543 RepID=A0ABN1J8H1_9CLOT
MKNFSIKNSMKFKNSSLKTRIVLSSLIIFFLTTLVLSSSILLVVDKKFKEQVRADGINLVTQEANKFIGFNAVSKQIDNLLDQKLFSVGYSLNQAKNISNDYLKKLAKETKIQEINLTDKTGKIIYSNMEENINFKFTSEYAVYSLLGSNKKPISESIRQSKVNHNYYKYCGVAASNGGLIQLGMEANEINKLKNSMSPQTLVDTLAKDDDIVFALVMDKSLKVTSHSDKKRIGKILDDKGSKSAISSGKEYTSTYKYKGEEDVYDVIMPLKDKSGNLLGAIDIGLSLKTQNSALKSIITISILVSLIGLLIASLLLIYITRKSLNPLSKLSDIATKVSKGDLTEKINIESNDEIGVLAFSFNSMIDNLREITKHINEFSLDLVSSSQEILSSSEQTSSASQEIATSTQEISNGAENQVTATNEASTAMNDIMTNIYDMKSEVDEIVVFSQTTNELASDGKTNMTKMTNQMETIKDSVSYSAEVINELESTSKEIGKIVEIMNGIADQTNLLALNASIEAARAGQAGKGFAVVADEVRKLAEESIKSSSDIQSLIVNTQNKTKIALESIKKGDSESSKGQKIVINVATSLDKILNSFASIDSKFKNIDTMVNSSTDNFTNVATKLYNVETISKDAQDSTEAVAASTEEQSATIEEMTAAIQTLVGMAENLQQSVAVFKTEKKEK